MTPSPPTNPATRRRSRRRGGVAVLAGPAVTGISSVGTTTAAVAAGGRGRIGDEGGKILELGGFSIGSVDRPRAVAVAVLPRRLEIQLVTRFGGVGALEHVEHHDGDVVAAAVGVGQGHECVGGGLGFLGGGEHGGDVVVADFVDQPVTADDESITPDHRQRPCVDAEPRGRRRGRG